MGDGRDSGPPESLRPTNHALERWAQRFVGLEMTEELRTSERVNRNQLGKYYGLRQIDKSMTFLRATGRSQAVFVVSPSGAIVTVLKPQAGDGFSQKKRRLRIQGKRPKRRRKPAR